MNDGADPHHNDATIVVRRLLSANAVAHERQAQLQRALDSRVVLEQAKGMLAERFGVTVDEAFVMLRRTARSRQLNLHEAARLVLADDPELGAALRGR
jgi:AmiR/NasT family two-component response regulator